jgi:formylglycine-generating enzyme required for sulfatase activity
LLALGKEDQVSGYQIVVSLGEGGLCEFIEPIDDKFRLKEGVPYTLVPLILQDVAERNSIWYPLYKGGFFSELLYPMKLIPNADFYMGVYEVTQDLYKAVMGKNPSAFKGDRNPVEKVYWFGAIKFCNKLSELEGLEPVYTAEIEGMELEITEDPFLLIDSEDIVWNKEANGYRLPSEKEWAYAAKGGENYKYAGSNYLGDVAWYRNNAGQKTHPVGQKKSNGFGLYDMSGNVFEWVWDIDPNDGDFRVIRGGSWSSSPSYMRASSRYYNNPRDRDSSIGFRMARNA